MRYIAKNKKNDVESVKIPAYVEDFWDFVSGLSREELQSYILDVVSGGKVSEKVLGEVLFMMRDYLPEVRREKEFSIIGEH